MEIVIILITIYLLSIYGAYKFVQLSYHNKKGRWNNILPDIIDIIVTFFPFVNSALSIMLLLGEWKRESYKNQINFFKPKNNGRDR